MKPIKKIGILAYKEMKDVSQTIGKIIDWNESQGNYFKLFISNNIKPQIFKASLVKSQDYLIKNADLILSLGGDGTFLSAARLARGSDIPILGVNLGKKGFLADASVENLPSILQKVKKSAYSTQMRMTLDVKVYKDRKIVFEDQALNDVVFTGKMGQELIDMEVLVNNQYLTNYWVDGLLVSTPTGSTAYSLSAGGPIIHPATQALLITPINPQSLSVRPLILSTDYTIKIKSKNPTKKFVKMVTDGREKFQIKPSYSIKISTHPISTHILRPEGLSYLEAIRKKLGWSGYHGVI